MYVAMFPKNGKSQSRILVYLISRSFPLVDGIILSSIWILLLLPLPPLLLLLLRLKTFAQQVTRKLRSLQIKLTLLLFYGFCRMHQKVQIQ
jgi:hypothetical protein